MMLGTCLAAALALIASALMAAGCGGSSKSATQTAAATQEVTQSKPTAPVTRPVTNAELIATTSAACLRIHAKTEDYRPKTSGQLAQAAQELSSYEEQQIAELEKLAPSGSLTSDWKQIVNDLKLMAENTHLAGVYMSAKEPSRLQGLTGEVNNARLRVLAISKRDGFTGCKKIVL